MKNQPCGCHGGVLVSHPGRQHAYETAVAAQERGLLCRFATGLYSKRGSMGSTALRLLPGKPRRSIERELDRRRHPEIDPGLVRTVPLEFSAATGFRRLLGAQAPKPTKRLDVWANRRFDAAIGRWLLSSGHTGPVHAFEGCALNTFKAAKQLGLTTILDVPGSHESHASVIAAEGGDVTFFDTERIRAERLLADHCIAPSVFVERCLTEHGVPAGCIVRIPYGTDPERFGRSVGRLDDVFRVLFVGKIGIRKGVRYLLDAWAQLSLPRAELVLLGGADEYGRDLLHRYRGVFRWIGELPHHEVHHWFSQSDVFAFPSLAEGSALVTYEALASGLPVVTTPDSGSVVEDGLTGFLVPPRDAVALASRIRLLHETPTLRLQMGHLARSVIEHNYTWRHYRQRIGTFYSKILDAPRVPSPDAPKGPLPRSGTSVG